VNRRHRKNLAGSVSESWTPPPLVDPTGSLGRWTAAIRRYFDLQAGSIWDDLADLLVGQSGKLVDVGCGGQPYRSLMPAGVEYVGIDVAQAKERFGYHARDTVYFTGSIWPDAALGADVVLCTEALEHILDPRAFLEQALRCLRPGGRLVLTVPFAARWHFVPYDYWRFTPSSLQHLLTAAGFDEVEVFARGNAVTVACYKAMALVLPLLAPQRSSFIARRPT
jgi:SAM-dependent methyltransferase